MEEANVEGGGSVGIQYFSECMKPRTEAYGSQKNSRHLNLH